MLNGNLSATRGAGQQQHSAPNSPHHEKIIVAGVTWALGSLMMVGTQIPSPRDLMALVVFLRGVNVGGHRAFRPSILAQQLKQYDVVNVGAAGTFVIRKPPGQAELRAELQRRLPFEVEVMICTGQDLITMASGNPFGNETIASDVVRFVSVLAKRPPVLPALPLSFPAEGEWLLKIIATENRFIFGMYRRHMKAIQYLSKMDALFRVPVTTRNWNTFTAIIKLLKGGS